MPTKATSRKIKRSFTLAPEALAFVVEVRRKRKAASDSEALNLLIEEQMLQAKQLELDAAIREYYDNAGEDELEDSKEWAAMAGPAVLLSSEPHESERR